MLDRLGRWWRRRGQSRTARGDEEDANMRAPAWMRQEDSGRAGSTESFSVDEDCPAKARKILGSDAAVGQVSLNGRMQ